MACPQTEISKLPGNCCSVEGDLKSSACYIIVSESKSALCSQCEKNCICLKKGQANLLLSFVMLCLGNNEILFQYGFSSLSKQRLQYRHPLSFK